jgi:prepilin-type N-terminal cleavage/methylation domain-containing protein
MTRRSGMTLIEVLLAVSLLSVLSVAIAMSFRLGISAMGRTTAKIAQNRRAAGAQRILEQQLEGLIPALADCEGQRKLFFEGGPRTMRFVSTYSLEEAWRGHSRILEFQVIPGDQGRGVRLVVNEHVYTGPKSLGPFCRPGLPVGIGPASFVLADRLAYCRFAYQEPAPPPVEAGPWRPDWVAPKWPRAVRIEMGSLDEDAGKLRPMTLTARMRVDRYPVFDYGDF